MRAAIYARYSAGPRQTDQSIEGQLRACRDYCKNKDITIVDEYCDRHISGRTDARPEFQRLITDASKKKFDAVVVYKTDRFARNKYDSAIYKQQLKKNGVTILYAAESIPDGPEGIILESLMEGLAEYYSAELSQKIKRGMHESALKCKSTGAGTLLGYKVLEDKTFEIDPEGAKAVQTVFDMYIRGERIVDICDYLNKLGFKTSQKKQFTNTTIERVIKNEKYTGVYIYDGVKIEGGMPRIISDEIFRKAQREMQRRKDNRTTRKPRAEYALAGKLFCGYCKRAMTGVSGTGKLKKVYYYYTCPTARAKAGCSKKKVSRDWIEELVISQTVKYLLQPDKIKSLAHKLFAYQQAQDSTQDDIKIYKRKLAENKTAIANLLTLIEQGNTSKAIGDRIVQLENEQAAIQDKIDELSYKRPLLTQEEIEALLQRFLKADENPEEYKRRIIKSFISAIYLYDDELLIYYNLQEGGTLATSRAAFSNEVFDFIDKCSTTYRQSRTPESKLMLSMHGVLLVAKLKDEL